MFNLVWFRNNLRILDNLPLFNAVNDARQKGIPVIALFIATPKTWQQHKMALIKEDLIRRRVLQLQQELKALNIPLFAVEASDYASVAEVFQQWLPFGIQALYAQTEYELREQQRDKQVTTLLDRAGVSCHWYDTQCLQPPGSIYNKQHLPYKVFTPFKKALLENLNRQGISCLQKPPAMTDWPQINLPDYTKMHIPTGISAAWPVEELHIIRQLRVFCQNSVTRYSEQRDFPAVNGTSSLSPYLSIGVISVQQCVSRLLLEYPDTLLQSATGAAVWLSELIWREFYKHLLVAFPDLIKHQPFQQDTAAIQWRNNTVHFDAWCAGKTGYPIVDAAMRQLNQTGWMHNRLRMISASFLVKDLHIDWRWGEEYFMSKLIDGDFSANNGGWQWAASTGTDAVPYFRIFNPVTQSEKYDPDGHFIRTYLPELAECQGKKIHWPHPEATASGYVEPIVEHNAARLVTLELFAAAKNAGNKI